MLNVVEKIGDEVITHDGVCVDNNNKDIYIKIDTNNLRRTFSYSYNDKDYNKLLVWIMSIICVMKEFVRVSVLQVQ